MIQLELPSNEGVCAKKALSDIMVDFLIFEETYWIYQALSFDKRFCSKTR